MERRVQYYIRDGLDGLSLEDIDISLSQRELDAGGVLLFSDQLVDGEKADDIERRIHNTITQQDEDNEE